jgi:hypothetical protein
MDDLYRDALEDTKQRVDRWAKILAEYGRSDDRAWRGVYQMRRVLEQELRLLNGVSSRAA